MKTGHEMTVLDAYVHVTSNIVDFAENALYFVSLVRRTVPKSRLTVPPSSDFHKLLEMDVVFEIGVVAPFQKDSIPQKSRFPASI